MNDLRTLLETATDRIEAPHLGLAAAQQARRRRVRRRGAVASVAVAAVVAAVLLVPDGAPQVQPAPAPGTPTPTLTTPAAPDSTSATQPLWDPFDLPDAPRRESVLPGEMAPPAAPLPISQDPAPAVVVAWPEGGRDLHLFGVDGRWRSVPGTEEGVAGLVGTARPAISSDGTRVAMSTRPGILVVDVTTGDEQVLPWPGPIAPPWDTAPTVVWTPGDEGLLVLHWRETWTVDLGGDGSKGPYGGGFVALGVDPRGSIYQNDYDRRRLLTWQDDQVVHEAPFIQCERMVGGYGLLACTAGSMTPFRSGPVVVDPATGEVVAYAPIKDPSSVYSDNGHLTALGFLDDDTLLLNVGPADFRTGELGEEAWHLVAWQFRTGNFELITSGDRRMRAIAVAPALVDRDSP